jgi:uracil phosphoribosyltransferase
MGVHIVEHPLLADALATLRDATTPPAAFRAAMARAGALLFTEASRDLPADPAVVRTPLAEAPARRLRADVLTLVPVLRAGLGLLDGILPLVPGVRVALLGLKRDEATAEAAVYYENLPAAAAGSLAFVLDPMLATGGTLVRTLEILEDAGIGESRVICVVAAPEGIRALREAYTEIEVWCAAVDEGLDERSYIVPGLGDAGDRIFGT